MQNKTLKGRIWCPSHPFSQERVKVLSWDYYQMLNSRREQTSKYRHRPPNVSIQIAVTEKHKYLLLTPAISVVLETWN